MNLVLFEPDELKAPLPPDDARARHILAVLRRSPGDTFVAGLVDGPSGLATLLAADAAGLLLSFTPAREPPPPPPVVLIVGLPRPQTARDLLRDLCSLGCSCIHFVATERSDPNYAASTLWTSGEWRRHLLAGASQACDTRLPRVTRGRGLAAALADLPAADGAARLALDNYEATTPLATALPPAGAPLALALGPERGWGPGDRAALRAAGFTLCSLGERVLRLETAATLALGLALHGRGG